ncbi:Neuferricin [Papilio machaon]|uniref:Neuferricin n=1 Tax=Papilio machaon TaxID=76193 RepID=A0A194QRS9_PAPMA|nr:Neuferricin [Papilio machaon]
MGLYSCFRRNIKVSVSIIVIIISVLCYKKYEELQNFTTEPRGHRLVFSQEQLNQYDGHVQDKLYMAVLGQVFDVTDGRQHYERGSSYHYFIGKDGSRALVTGNFNDESSMKDHVLDLSCNDLSTLLNWRKTYRKKYKFVGFLNGRYYDEHGTETNYFKQFKSKLKECETEKINQEKENLKYPPCNIAWNEEEGSHVWCTKTSGGIARNWVGVPRQLFTPGEEKPRCVCVNYDMDSDSTNLLKKYADCPDTSTMCNIFNT